MALATNTLPYGIRDVKVYPLDAAGAPTTGQDLPAMQTFSFTEAEEFAELRGDDVLLAVRGRGPQVEWSLESGGISLNAAALIVGGTVTASGTTPNAKLSLLKKGTDARPYFRAEGQAISDSGGDFHAKVFKCKADQNFEGTLTDGEFWVSNLSGKGLPDVNNNLYELIANETAVAVSTTPSSP